VARSLPSDGAIGLLGGGPIKARRKFFVLADVAAKARGKLPAIAPPALEAVRRIDAAP